MDGTAAVGIQEGVDDAEVADAGVAADGACPRAGRESPAAPITIASAAASNP